MGGSGSGGGGPSSGVEGWGPPRRHVHDSVRPIRLTVALGLKNQARNRSHEVYFGPHCTCLINLCQERFKYPQPTVLKLSSSY